MMKKVISKRHIVICCSISVAILSSLILSKVILIFAFGDYDFFLPWPGVQVLPSILFEQGFLQQDPYSMDAQNTPYSLSATLLNTLFFGELSSITTIYASSSYLFDIVAVVVTSLSLIIIATRILKTSAYKDSESVNASLWPLLPVIMVALAFIDQTPLRDFKPQSADWWLPVTETLNPQGLGWVLAMASLLFYLTFTRKAVGVIIGSVVLFIASLIHPVIPLIIPLILVLIAFLEFQKTACSHLFISVVAAIFACAAGIVATAMLFPEANASIAGFYEVYVVERHPHHYLPSQYVSSRMITKLAFYIAIVTIIFFLLGQLTWSIIVAVLILAVGPHALQYILVEILQIDGFIKLGPSRLIMAFNFITITLGMCSAAVLLSCLFSITSKVASAVSKRVWTTLAVICNLITLIAVVGIFFFGWSYKVNNFSNRIEISISSVIEENNWTGIAIQRINMSPTILSYAVPMHLREVGGLAVYWDFYFPFSPKAAIDWSRRHKTISAIEECLAESTLSVCSITLQHEKVLFLTEGLKPSPHSVTLGSIKDTDLWLTPSWL